MKSLNVKAALKRLFMDNLKIKLSCLFLAFVAWVFVASNQSLLGKFPNQIPVSVTGLSQDFTSFLDQENVDIYLMAESSIWGSLTSGSFTASVDATGLSEGTYELEVKVVSSVSGVQVTRVEPSKIFVTIEKMVSKSIPVTATIDGDTLDGMMLGEVSLSPENVKVTGASSLIESISEARAEIRLNGESASFERELEVYAVSEGNNKMSGISFEPAKVLAKVAVVKGGNNKTVGVKVKTKNSPKDGYFVSSIVATPNVIDITGQRSLLTSIGYIETEEIDLSLIDSVLAKDVKVILPQGVTLQKGQGNQVSISITLSQISSVKPIIPTISALSLAEGLKIVSTRPSDLTLNLAGPIAVLNGLSTSNVKLDLNLAGKGVGEHTIALSPEMLVLPAGISVVNFSSNSIIITLSN